jgi:formylglycine-generating enzyme required for sulfatase activity
LGDKCGTSSSENCCTSSVIPGGTFDRENDLHDVATVADFRLDKYEVTVGRFRKFVNATLGGWTPPKGAGKHEHLNSGKGLANGDGTAFETGWQPEWTAMLPATIGGWATALSCSESYRTWSPVAGSNEKLPINCVDGVMANAFCIWDAAFLPTTTELNYAQAGGDEQRIYPWGEEIPGENANLAAYGCYFGGGAGTCTGTSSIPAVGSIPAGAGKWGHLDLGGSLFEWAIVWSGGSTGYARSGSSFVSDARYLLVAGFTGFTVAPKPYEFGLRCARMP